ncbi:lipoprotein [Spiroplasma mirum]|nr:lipoprotein [Spiroplasma mirum]AKM52967.1 hypothetical protein SATRI_v1c04670 [Spiroplasma atrichopogonis]
MKKLLVILTAVGLTATRISSIVAYNKSDSSDITD